MTALGTLRVSVCKKRPDPAIFKGRRDFVFHLPNSPNEADHREVNVS